jgi:D-alanine-D-alanine ligase-like ATP-grasp enzyme
LTTVLPDGQVLSVRKTANLHTGGTIHDVTDETCIPTSPRRPSRRRG